MYRRKSGAPQPEVIAVNYDQIRKGTEKDILLEPFDIVEVGKSKKSIGDILARSGDGYSEPPSDTDPSVLGNKNYDLRREAYCRCLTRRV